MALTGEQIKQVAPLLAKTLENDLESYVHASTGDRLYVEYAGRGKPLRLTVIDLLNSLEDLGTTAIFLRYVYAHRPDRGDVRQAIAQLCPEAAVDAPDREVALSAQTAGVVQADAPTNAFVPGFQRNVRPYLPMLDIGVWRRNLMEIERRVCRVELRGNSAGTGFLVGPDAVLTNWHVIEAARKAGDLGALGCRFDYVLAADGRSEPGQLVALHPDGCVDDSPYSHAETTPTPDNPPPTSEELDYALLRLATPIGEQSVEGAAARGWIALPTAAFPLPANAPLLIAQHPQQATMKLAQDTQAVVGLNANGTRLRYKTNTEPGSSGSPCFTIDWNIVALHHFGDPNWQRPVFNQGVPIELIRQRIDARGFGTLLGH